MKKILSIMLAILVLASLLSACKQKENRQESDTTATENSSDAETTLQEEQNADTYKPGKWTTSGYTSEWLNMSFNPSPYFSTTTESIEITKKYNEALKANNPSSSITEMEFESADNSDDSLSILLTVELIADPSKDPSDYALEDATDIQDYFGEYNLPYQHLERNEQTVTFLGEEYLRSYHAFTVGINKTKATESYAFYRIKDNYLVCLSFVGNTSTMDLGLCLSCFSTLDGTIQGNDGLGEDSNKLFGTLDYNTVWSFVWTTANDSYTVSLGFEEDGTCYYLLHDFEIYEGGKGTYTVKDGNILSIKITAGGKKAGGVFRFDSATNTLHVASKDNFLGNPGDSFYVENIAEFDFDQLKGWGTDFSKK